MFPPLTGWPGGLLLVADFVDLLYVPVTIIYQYSLRPIEFVAREPGL